jgi:hypothetical protein
MDKQAPPTYESDSRFGAAEAYYSRGQGRTAPQVPPVLQGLLPSTASEEINRARRTGTKIYERHCAPKRDCASIRLKQA